MRIRWQQTYFDNMKSKIVLIKFAIIILPIIFLYSFQKNDRYKNDELILNAKVLKYKKINKANYLIVKVSLNNSSADTLKYIVYSCYYPFYHGIKPSKYFSFDNEDCDRNVPELIKIPPKGKISTILKLKINDSIRRERNANFKIGVRLITVPKTFDLLNGNINFLGFDPDGAYVYSSGDTTYKENITFRTIKNTGYDKPETTNYVTVIKILWSNKIKL